MATNDKPAEDKKVDVQMPDVEEPVREKSAGKWAVWFIIIVVAALIITFLVK